VLEWFTRCDHATGNNGEQFMNDVINPVMDKATDNLENLIDNLTVLEDTGWLPSEDMDEIAYYLMRIATIVGMPLDIDRINDQHLLRAAE
jgi:hypothetical protein